METLDYGEGTDAAAGPAPGALEEAIDTALDTEWDPGGIEIAPDSSIDTALEIDGGPWAGDADAGNEASAPVALDLDEAPSPWGDGHLDAVPAAAALDLDPGVEPAGTADVGGSQQLDAQESLGLAIDVPGGKAFFESDAKVLQAAQVLPEFPGEYKYDLHGYEDLSGVMLPGHAEPVDAASFAEVVAADPSWTGDPIRLFSCYTGKTRPDGTSFGQELADKLGVPVTAPTDMAWSDGSDYGVDNGGEWVTFTPTS